MRAKRRDVPGSWSPLARWTDLLLMATAWAPECLLMSPAEAVKVRTGGAEGEPDVVVGRR